MVLLRLRSLWVMWTRPTSASQTPRATFAAAEEEVEAEAEAAREAQRGPPRLLVACAPRRLHVDGLTRTKAWA
jgi:hypothetical protein